MHNPLPDIIDFKFGYAKFFTVIVERFNLNTRHVFYDTGYTAISL